MAIDDETRVIFGFWPRTLRGWWFWARYWSPWARAWTRWKGER
jgi:hypothetical protein